MGEAVIVSYLLSLLLAFCAGAAVEHARQRIAAENRAIAARNIVHVAAVSAPPDGVQ